MAIQDLRDSAGMPLSGLHARLTVVDAKPVVRARIRSALATRPDVVVLDSSSIASRVGDDEGDRARQEQGVARLEALAAQFRLARDEAGEAMVNGIAGVEAALGSLDDFDQAERELSRALILRDRATTAEAVMARRLAEVLERRQRLAEQRQDAIRVIEQIETGGPVRRSAELRRQIADMEAGLARAEAEQIRSERAAEATLHQARESRLAAAGDLERADRVLRGDLPGVAGITTQEWPPGPPLPVLVAERRDHIAAVLAERYSNRGQAKAAMDAASEGLRAAERDLEEARRSTASLGLASTLEVLFRPGPAGAQENHLFLCDEPFAGLEHEVVTAVLEHVARRSIQVVYLTEDERLLAWAAGLPVEVGTLMPAPEDGPATPSATITRLRPPTPPADPDPYRDPRPNADPGPNTEPTDHNGSDPSGSDHNGSDHNGSDHSGSDHNSPNLQAEPVSSPLAPAPHPGRARPPQPEPSPLHLPAGPSFRTTGPTSALAPAPPPRIRQGDPPPCFDISVAGSSPPSPSPWPCSWS